MSGLMFPKQGTKKKRKEHSESIIQRKDGTCFLCSIMGNRSQQYVHKHHIFGASDRDKSERFGLTVYLCVPHHETSAEAVHRNRDTALYLKRIGQQAFEEKYSHEEFMREFGRNWI